jgi:hypothetical protein
MAAPKGNKNGQVEEPANSFLHMRCQSRDKSAWVKVAGRALKAKEIEADSRGCLAAWVTKTLNQAAEAQGFRTSQRDHIPLARAGR